MNALTPKGANLIRLSSSVSVVAVFFAALLLSWHGLTLLAIDAGFPIELAWALPIAVDGTVLAGAGAVLHANLTGASTRFGWSLLTGGALVSVWGNMSSSMSASLTGRITHALAPLAMAASLHALMLTVKHRIDRAAKLAAEEEAARRAEAERERKEQRRAAVLAMPTAGDAKAMAALVATLPEGTSNTDKVLTIITSGQFPKPKAAHLALALGLSDSPEDARLAAKALERARAKARKLQLA